MNPKQGTGQPSDSLSRSEDLPKAGPRQILVVEDNKADVFLIRSAIELAQLNADLHIATDGEKAVTFLAERDQDDCLPAPDLVILDINLPKKHGSEVLRHLRLSRRSAKAAVVVVTSSESEGDRRQMMQFGADAYFSKPSDYDAFMKLGDLIKKLLFSLEFPAQGSGGNA